MGSFLLQHQMASPCNVAISQNMSAASSKRFKSTSELRRPLQDRGASRASSSLKRGSSRITRSANDHQVAAGLFECFFRCGDLILWAKTFALYEIIPRPERPREQFPGLLRARFVTLSLCQMASTASFNGRKTFATFCTSPIPLSVNLRCGSSSSDFASPC